MACVEENIKDFEASTVMWHQYYRGIEPKSMIQELIYTRRLKKAVQNRVHGHADSVNCTMVSMNYSQKISSG
jgi:hypothetical protein